MGERIDEAAFDGGLSAAAIVLLSTGVNLVGGLMDGSALEMFETGGVAWFETSPREKL